MGTKPKGAAAPSAEADNNTRQPVTVRGADLAKLVAATGGMYLTQDEAGELVKDGYATVDTSNLQGETAFVTLTPAGAELIAPQPAKEKPVFEIDDDVPMPEAPKKRGRNRGSKYPFEKLEIGKSFHVPKTKEMPDPVSALASSLTGARRRYEVPVLDGAGKPVVESVKVKVYAKDKDGKRIKDANNKFVVASETLVEKPKMQQTRDFTVIEVGADDPRGAGARVFRTK